VNDLENALCHDGGLPRPAPGEEHHHLVAPETEERSGITDGFPQAGGELAQDIIAARVAEGIIDTFEVIDIQHEDRNGTRTSQRCCNGAPHRGAAIRLGAQRTQRIIAGDRRGGRCRWCRYACRRAVHGYRGGKESGKTKS
jgi:hypothetical protein